jgi:hypothetical protein
MLDPKPIDAAKAFKHDIQGERVRPDHIGSTVRWVPKRARGDSNHPDCLIGEISQITKKGIAVRFKNNSASWVFEPSELDQLFWEK